MTVTGSAPAKKTVRAPGDPTHPPKFTYLSFRALPLKNVGANWID